MNQVSEIRKLLVEIEGIASTSDDLELVATTVAQLEDLKKDLKMVKESVDSQFFNLMGDEPEIMASGKRVSVAWSTPRKAWQHKDLLDTVKERIKQLSIDLDTGEVHLTVDEMADRVLQYAHVDYWRVKELKELDINPDRFCTLGEEKKTVKIEDY